MILVIDNYDSFVYNLARYCGLLGYSRQVVRNDAITRGEIAEMAPEAIILSPGPCTPDEAGISRDVIRDFAATTPILGVCLGHQCIAEVYGGRTVRGNAPIHGRTSTIHHNGHALFEGLPEHFEAARYHSLISELDTHNPLEIAARTDDGTIMGLAHTDDPVYGVQFHPESVLTDNGLTLMRNFTELSRQWHHNTTNRQSA
jgi:anthranilate synthase component 2/para-aminobenzoate synthetase component 2